MPLKAAEIDNLSCPENKSQIKKFDSNGLFLLVKRNGSKLWRFKYMYAGKHKELSFGQYPKITLSMARKRRDDAKLCLSENKDPSLIRKEQKRKASGSSFEKVAKKWLEKNQEKWTEEYVSRVDRWITADCKSLSKLPLALITAKDIADIMIMLDKRGHAKKASTIHSIITRIFSYGIAHGHAENNPSQYLSLKDIISSTEKTNHYAAITDQKLLGQLMHDISNHKKGGFYTRQALRLIPHIFLRQAELRRLKWEHIDFENMLIRAPAEIMKTGIKHLVPISDEVNKKLLELKKYSGHLSYLFPNERNAHEPMSKNVITTRLRDMGYSADVMTGHGFRGTASTILHEKGFEHDVIETQLAHLTGTNTSRSYNHAKYLPERVKMMQWWSDFLIKLQAKHEQRLLGNTIQNS